MRTVTASTVHDEDDVGCSAVLNIQVVVANVAAQVMKDYAVKLAPTLVGNIVRFVSVLGAGQYIKDINQFSRAT